MPDFRQRDSRANLRLRLLRWYRRQARDLPWRRTRQPYRIWLSEIMLQQTQVDTVKPYYRRFLKAFPTVRHLAQAKPDQVFKLWEGLGYYRRAHHLQQAARIVVEKYRGHFPTRAVDWMQLPGVGRYTANAIASIAFGEAVPVVDGNVKRVLARWMAWPQPVDSALSNRRFWTWAEEFLSSRQPGDFNQAMMELGALICTPRMPKCLQCPVRRDCAAFLQNRVDLFPRQQPHPPRPHYKVVAGIIMHRGRCLLGKRRPGGLLGGLWEFPGGKIQPGEKPAAALERELWEELEIRTQVGEKLATVEHAYTHFSITLHAFACTFQGGTPQRHDHVELRWVPWSRIRRYALPKADLKIIEQIPTKFW